MAAVNKPEQIRLRVSPAHKQVIDGLAGSILTNADVASMLMEAAIEAVQRSNGRFHYPLRFEVSDEMPANRPKETPPKK
jgi:hypothetical protein